MYHKSIVCCYLYPITKYGYPPPAENTPQYIQEMYDLGFQSMELEGIREQHLLEVYDHRYSIQETIRKLQVSVPYFCTVLPGLSSTDKRQRQHNFRLFEKGCEIAQLFGATGVLDNAPLPPFQFPRDIPVVRHYGPEALARAFLPPDLRWPQYWDDLVNTLQEVCDMANQYGLTYQMHPCLGVLAAHTEGFLYLRDAIKRDNLRFNLDTANQFMLHDNLVLALHRAIDSIDYIHISDNRGTIVEHLEPEKGNIPWDSFFATLNQLNFTEHIGLDIGGAESNVPDIDAAYQSAATWLETNTGWRTQ